MAARNGEGGCMQGVVRIKARRARIQAHFLASKKGVGLEGSASLHNIAHLGSPVHCALGQFYPLVTCQAL